MAQSTFETLSDSLEDPSLDLGLESYSSQCHLFLLKPWRRLKFRQQLFPQKSLHLSSLTAASTLELTKITNRCRFFQKPAWEEGCFIFTIVPYIYHTHASVSLFQMKIMFIRSHNWSKDIPSTERKICNAQSNSSLEIKILKELLQVNKKERQIPPAKKWTKNMDRQFMGQETQMSNKHLQRCATSLEIIQWKSKPDEMPGHTCKIGTSIKPDRAKCGQGCGQWGTPSREWFNTVFCSEKMYVSYDCHPFPEKPHTSSRSPRMFIVELFVKQTLQAMHISIHRKLYTFILIH